MVPNAINAAKAGKLSNEDSTDAALIATVREGYKVCGSFVVGGDFRG
jgi:hypothetical protein